MRTIEQFGRRRILIFLPVAVLALSVAAWAYWSAPSSGSAGGHVGTLAAPSITGATPGAGTVALTWSAVSAPGGGTVSYYVSRDGGAPAGSCPGSSAPATQTSCTDSGLSVGKHSYTVTAVWRSWTARSESASAQVSSGAATHLVLEPATTTPTAGVADDLTITAEDASGNTVTSYSGAKSLTFGGASTIGAFHPTVTAAAGTATAFGTGETIDFSGGVASVSGSANGAMTLYKAETAKITVTDGTLSNGSGTSVTVGPASAASLSLSTPAGVTAGTQFAETLTALDAYGNTASGYGGEPAVTFAGPSSSPSGKAPSYPSKVRFSAGTGSATITLYDAGEGVALSATQGSIAGSSAGFAVSAAGASSLALSTPAGVDAGGAFGETLSALDSYGNVATSYSGSKSVSFSGPSSSPGGKAPSYPATVSFTAGESKPAASITLYDAQTTTLGATQGALKGSSSSFTVAPAGASSFALATPGTQTAGTAFSVSLTAKDEYGNTASGYAGAKTLAFSGPAESPGGEAPKYPASVSFSAGAASAQVTLYDAQTTTLTAKEGAISGTSAGFAVNAKSTTTQFGVAVPSGASAGTAFSATLTAQDEYGNTTSGYSGQHTISFSGPGKSPNGTSPKYPSSSTSFNAGVGDAQITLYDAQTTALKASASGVSGESESFTVAPGSLSSLSATTPATQTAGTPFTLTLTGAKDGYGNTVSGSQPLAFSGPSSSPNGASPTYPSSATFSATGEAKATITLVDAQTTTLKATSGSASATTGSFTVNAGATSALSLAAATTTPTAGSADSLTITATDADGNTATGYNGAKSLTFGGAKASGSNGPTVTNSSGTAVAFGQPTAISFSSGIAKASGSSNGVMKLYALETAHVTVSDGTYGNGAGLAVSVEGAKIAALSLVNGNFGFSSKGKIEAGDSFVVEFSDPIAVSSMCSLWSGNTSNHSLTGNGEVTVTVTNGSGSGDDTLSVSASKCTLHLGTIDLGSGSYVSGGNVTFSGNGSNASTVEYNATSHTLEVGLGSQGGSGKTAQVSSSAATLTPEASLTDEFGNTFAPFTTAVTAQF